MLFGLVAVTIEVYGEVSCVSCLLPLPQVLGPPTVAIFAKICSFEDLALSVRGADARW